MTCIKGLKRRQQGSSSDQAIVISSVGSPGAPSVQGEVADTADAVVESQGTGSGRSSPAAGIGTTSTTSTVDAVQLAVDRTLTVDGSGSVSVGDVVEVVKMVTDHPDLKGRFGQVVWINETSCTVRINCKGQLGPDSSSATQVAFIDIDADFIRRASVADGGYDNRLLLSARYFIHKYTGCFEALLVGDTSECSKKLEQLESIIGTGEALEEPMLREAVRKVVEIICLYVLERGVESSTEIVCIDACQLLVQLLLDRWLSSTEKVVMQAEYWLNMTGSDGGGGLQLLEPYHFRKPMGSADLLALRATVKDGLSPGGVRDSAPTGTERYVRLIEPLTNLSEIPHWKGSLLDKPWECALCHESSVGVTVLPCCSNHLHSACLEKLREHSTGPVKCPLCRVRNLKRPTSEPSRANSPAPVASTSSPRAGAVKASATPLKGEEKKAARLQVLRSAASAVGTKLLTRLTTIERTRETTDALLARKRDEAVASADAAREAARKGVSPAVCAATNRLTSMRAQETKAQAKAAQTQKKIAEAQKKLEEMVAAAEGPDGPMAKLRQATASCADLERLKYEAEAAEAEEIAGTYNAAVVSAQEAYDEGVRNSNSKQQADAEAAQVKSEERAAQIEEERGSILAEFPGWAADDEEQQLLWRYLESKEEATDPTALVHHMEIASPQEVHVADEDTPDFEWSLAADLRGVCVTVDEVLVCTVLTGEAGEELSVQWCEPALGRSVQDMDAICAAYRTGMPECLTADLATALKGARVSEERATGKKGWRFSKNTSHTDLASLVLAAGRAASERGRHASYAGKKPVQVLFDTCAACHLGDSDIARELNRQPDKSKSLRVVGVDQIPKETQGECLLEVVQETTDKTEVTIGVEAQIDDIGHKVILSAPGLIRDQNVIVVMGLDPVSNAWSSFLQFPNGQLINLSLTKGGMTVLGADSAAWAGGNVSEVSDPTDMVMEILVRW